MICLARAERTCWDASVVMLLTQGKIRARMTSLSTSFEKPGRIGFQGSCFPCLPSALTWDLTSGGGSHLGFIVAEQLGERLDEFLPDDILSHGRCQLPNSCQQAFVPQGNYPPRQSGPLAYT